MNKHVWSPYSGLEEPVYLASQTDFCKPKWYYLQNSLFLGQNNRPYPSCLRYLASFVLNSIHKPGHFNINAPIWWFFAWGDVSGGHYNSCQNTVIGWIHYKAGSKGSFESTRYNRGHGWSFTQKIMMRSPRFGIWDYPTMDLSMCSTAQVYKPV